MGGLAQGLGIRLFAFGGAYWPLATAHSDPLWARTKENMGGRGGRRKQDENGTKYPFFTVPFLPFFLRPNTFPKFPL